MRMILALISCASSRARSRARDAVGEKSVATMIDRNGFNPIAYGKLPPQMAAICDSNMRMFEMTTIACLERSVEAAVHALLLDPLTSAVCTPAEIKEMALRLFKSQKRFLKGFK